MSMQRDVDNMKAEMRLLWEKVAELEKKLDGKQEKLSHRQLRAIDRNVVIGGDPYNAGRKHG